MRSARLILNHANRGSRASPGGSDLALCATLRNATRTRRSNLMTSYPPVALDLMLAAHGSAPLRGPEWRFFPAAPLRARFGSRHFLWSRDHMETPTISVCKAGTIGPAPAPHPCRAGACQFRWRLRNVPLEDCLWIWDYLARVRRPCPGVASPHHRRS